jgi:hypothetical protein
MEDRRDPYEVADRMFQEMVLRLGGMIAVSDIKEERVVHQLATNLAAAWWRAHWPDWPVEMPLPFEVPTGPVRLMRPHPAIRFLLDLADKQLPGRFHTP